MSFKEIVLRGCGIRRSAALELARAVSVNKHLKELDLRNNDYSHAAIWCWWRQTNEDKPNTKMKILDLSSNLILQELQESDDIKLSFTIKTHSLLTPDVYDLMNDRISVCWRNVMSTTGGMNLLTKGIMQKLLSWFMNCDLTKETVHCLNVII